MSIAKLTAGRSKDPNTQVGACIVSKDNRVLSTGYNGAPNNFNDDDFPWDREGNPLETKYMFVCHAEANAIDNFRGYNRYADIKDGYKVIKAEFEFENLSTQDEYVSSYDFECYADGYACENFYSVDDSSFSTKLSAGKKTKGAVYFEVPKDANNIILEYELNYWTDSKAVFIVK